jgi:hypothetical protein
MMSGGKHVRGELDPAKIGLHRPGDTFYRQGFGQAGQPLQEEMAAAEQTDQQTLNQMFLTDHRLAELVSQRFHPGTVALYRGIDLVNRRVRCWSGTSRSMLAGLCG